MFYLLGGQRVTLFYLGCCEIQGVPLWLSYRKYSTGGQAREPKHGTDGRPTGVEPRITDQNLNITKENACKSKRFLICYSKMVTSTPRMWHTLWPSLVQLSERLEQLGIGDEEARNV